MPALVVMLALMPAISAHAFDERLVGSWQWLHEEFDEELGHAIASQTTITFGKDGTIKLEPQFYDHAPDVFYGTYEADGKTLRFTITKVELFFKDDGGSVYFEDGQNVSTGYSIQDGRLVMELFDDTREFKRVQTP